MRCSSPLEYPCFLHLGLCVIQYLCVYVCAEFTLATQRHVGYVIACLCKGEVHYEKYPEVNNTTVDFTVRGVTVTLLM